MSATIHSISTSNLQLDRLRRLLDEAETSRTRLNRRIRRVRNLIRSVESGDPMPDFDQLLASIPDAAPVRSTVPVSASPTPPGEGIPAASSGQPAPMAGHLGMGLQPGQQHPAQPPPGAAVDLASVDVGRLARMSPEELDRLPFGVVTLDSSGKVIGYNDTESRLAGLPREAVIGKSFFAEVAPCTRVREFEGRFRDFAAGRTRMALETFEFVFNFRKGAQRVVIMIAPARVRGRFHVSMIRR